jgi:hypothetical protein
MSRYRFALWKYAEVYERAEITIKQWSRGRLPLDDPDAMGKHLVSFERRRLGQRKCAVTRVHDVPRIVSEAKLMLAWFAENPAAPREFLED